jgi:hypothetical protein
MDCIERNLKPEELQAAATAEMHQKKESYSHQLTAFWVVRKFLDLLCLKIYHVHK